MYFYSRTQRFVKYFCGFCFPIWIYLWQDHLEFRWINLFAMKQFFKWCLCSVMVFFFFCTFFLLSHLIRSFGSIWWVVQTLCISKQLNFRNKNTKFNLSIWWTITIGKIRISFVLFVSIMFPLFAFWGIFDRFQ